VVAEIVEAHARHPEAVAETPLVLADPVRVDGGPVPVVEDEPARLRERVPPSRTDGQASAVLLASMRLQDFDHGWMERNAPGRAVGLRPLEADGHSRERCGAPDRECPGVEVEVTPREAEITPYVHVDVTGVGRPVSDMLREGLDGTDYYLSAVTLTSGTALRPTGMGSAEVSVGKEHLVSRLQVLLDRGRILLPEDKESRALVRELQDFELRASASGMASGAFKAGAHDDLAIALGLAVLYDPSRAQVRYFRHPWP
jgi:hypothetical protein